MFMERSFNKFMLIFWLLFEICIFSMIARVSSLQFNLSSIGPSEAERFLNLTGDSNISVNGIHLTPFRSDNFFSIGRATYLQPLHLWDKASGYLADFQTHFSFVIVSPNINCLCAGLTFFLAPAGSTIPNNITDCGMLGLQNDIPVYQISSSPDRFVAMEFDTNPNAWDPKFVHVGIDISSLVSVKTDSWITNVTKGTQNDAWISYDSTSKNFSMVYTSLDPSSGEISTKGISHVTDLREYLPEFVIVGFSAQTANNGCYEEHNIISWDFNSSNSSGVFSPGPGSAPPQPPPLNVAMNKGRKMSAGVVIGLAASLLVITLGLSALVALRCGLWRKSKTNEAEKEEDVLMHDFASIHDEEFEMGTGPKRLSYAELAQATNNFAGDYKLGEGGFGSVYKGFVAELNMWIAVKRVSSRSNQGPKEYASEVKIISQLRHRNLVKLIGWCHENRELLLVYDYMSNGSLDYHLFKGRSLLNWEVRYKIARGLASALLYLHEEWERCVVHRDIKSSNVMLDEDFNTKLGDFGLARIVDHDKGSQTTMLAGTIGYLAPECVITGKATKESDVYSFGVVALEIACGRNAINANAAENQATTIVQWIWDLYGKGKILDGADPKLDKHFDGEEMECLLVVGLWCAHPNYTMRPTMKQVINVLNFEVQLPTLPPNIPVATFMASPSISSAMHPYYLDLYSSRSGKSSSSYKGKDSSRVTASSSSSSQFS